MGERRGRGSCALLAPAGARLRPVSASALLGADMVAYRRVLVVGRDFDTADGWAQRQLGVVQLDRIDGDAVMFDPPDAVVLDLWASDDRQRAICWKLRDTLNVPLLALSRDQSPEVVVALLRRGADDVIADDTSSPVAAATVAAILRRRRVRVGGCSERITLGAAEIDLVRGVVQRPERAETLSPTEHRLLLALLRANGRACTHRELVMQVWGLERASARHYLRLYIRYLREKLEDDPRRPRVIINVWSVGYRVAWSSGDASSDPETCSPPARLCPPQEVGSSWTTHFLSSDSHRQPAGRSRRFAG